MAVGDATDITLRLKALLPPWFGGDATPVLDGILAGPAVVLSFVYNLIGYVALQKRIASATDGFLDLVSLDFYGAALPRLPQEADATFSARIRASFFPSRNIRSAVTAALTRLGLSVQVIEPWLPADCGSLSTAVAGAPSSVIETESGVPILTESGSPLLTENSLSIFSTPWQGLAWGQVGTWGSRSMPFQCLVIVTRPSGSVVTNAQIYAAIEAFRPVAIKVWVRIFG